MTGRSNLTPLPLDDPILSAVGGFMVSYQQSFGPSY